MFVVGVVGVGFVMVQQRRKPVRFVLPVVRVPNGNVELDQLAATGGQDPDAQPKASQSAVTRKGHGGIVCKAARAVNADGVASDRPKFRERVSRQEARTEYRRACGRGDAIRDG